MHCRLRTLIVNCQVREDKVMFDKHFTVLIIVEEEINCLRATLNFSGYIYLRQLI